MVTKPFFFYLKLSMYSNFQRTYTILYIQCIQFFDVWTFFFKNYIHYPNLQRMYTIIYVHNIKFTWIQCSLQVWAIIIDLDIGLCFWFSYQNIDIALRYGHMGFKRQMMDDYYPTTCRAEIFSSNAFISFSYQHCHYWTWVNWLLDHNTITVFVSLAIVFTLWKQNLHNTHFNHCLDVEC